MSTSDIATANPTVELVDSSPLLGNPQALLERAAVDGYLFFRGLLDRDRVLGLRRQMMQVVADTAGCSGTDPMDGIADVAAFDQVDPVAAAFCGTGVPLEAYPTSTGCRTSTDRPRPGPDLDLYDELLGGT